jgi:hypothetical protein
MVEWGMLFPLVGELPKLMPVCLTVQFTRCPYVCYIKQILIRWRNLSELFCGLAVEIRRNTTLSPGKSFVSPKSKGVWESKT